ncbi:MAG: hypothetical protein ACR2NK_18745 [Mariniblastus sp.]
MRERKVSENTVMVSKYQCRQLKDGSTDELLPVPFLSEFQSGLSKTQTPVFP